MIVTEFDQFKYVNLGGLDWDNDSFKLALYDTAPALSATSYTTTGEITDASYTPGGNALNTPLTITAGQILADPVEFTNLTAIFQYVVLYGVGTIAGVTDPLLVLYDLESALSITNMTWTFAWINNVIYELT